MSQQWNPLQDLVILQDRMNRLFEDATQRRAQGEVEHELERADWTPAADIYETESGYVIALDLPGIKRDALEIGIDDNRLIVKGTRLVSEEKTRRSERPRGNFYAVFRFRYQSIKGRSAPSTKTACCRFGCRSALSRRRRKSKLSYHEGPTTQQRQESQESQGRSYMGDEQQNEVRVTDRRRISLDPEGTGQGNVDVETPNLKPSYVEELEARTKAAEKQVQEVQARFDQLRQQLQRETDETRARLNRSADERAEAGKAKFIESLLPVLDDLDRAVEAAEKEGTHDAIVQGVRSTAARFQSALSSAGVEPIVSVGEPFDPELHEAVDTAEADPEMEGIVIAEYSRGFRIGDRLLRPARVKVGRAKQTKEYTEDSSRRRHESAG